MSLDKYVQLNNTSVINIEHIFIIPQTSLSPSWSISIIHSTFQPQVTTDLFSVTKD